MTTRVADMLKQKGSRVVTTSPTTTVFDVITKMVEQNVGSILITDGDDLVGIFTERDYLRLIILRGRASKNTRVEEVMTADVIRAAPQASLEECMEAMTRKRCRHLPVVDEGKIVGIISMGDCVKSLLNEAEDRVQDLTGYITGQYPG